MVILFFPVGTHIMNVKYRVLMEIQIVIQWYALGNSDLICSKGNELNSLWPGDATWQHRSGSTLAQVIAFCLMAPSYYLNQFLLIIKSVLWHSSGTIFTRNAHILYLIHNIYSEIAFIELLPHFPGANELTYIHRYQYTHGFFQRNMNTNCHQCAFCTKLLLNV